MIDVFIRKKLLVNRVIGRIYISCYFKRLFLSSLDFLIRFVLILVLILMEMVVIIIKVMIMVFWMLLVKNEILKLFSVIYYYIVS